MDNAAEHTYSSAVKNAVDAGRKIEAIKLYREEYGVGLKEAKDAIDRLAKERHANRAGDNAGIQESGRGGAGLIKLIVSIAILVVVYKLLTT